MKAGQTLWTREELILAINLYCKLPFGRLHKLNPEIISLAKLIGRTPSSVALKLGNFASLDPSLKARGIKGASNGSKLDREIWTDFFGNWAQLFFESELLLAKYQNTTVEELNQIPESELFLAGKTREQVVTVRVNQHIFRKVILSSYNNTCCVTGINNPGLLIASHIVPWAIDEMNRLNPQNGIAVNALHDKAFEIGLITISPEYKIVVSPLLLKEKASDYLTEYFLRYHNRDIILPSRFLPSLDFLKYHNDNRFQH